LGVINKQIAQAILPNDGFIRGDHCRHQRFVEIDAAIFDAHNFIAHIFTLLVGHAQWIWHARDGKHIGRFELGKILALEARFEGQVGLRRQVEIEADIIGDINRRQRLHQL